eukprot:8124915-Pyramimonas_sp.AAC.1
MEKVEGAWIGTRHTGPGTVPSINVFQFPYQIGSDAAPMGPSGVPPLLCTIDVEPLGATGTGAGGVVVASAAATPRVGK